VKRFVTDADYKREIRRLEKKAGGIRVMTGGQVSSESFDPIGGVQLKDSNSTFKTFLRQIGGDTYLTANAFFDGSTWRRVDTAKVSWALILRGSSNYPGGAAQAAELWTAPAGANPIGLFGSGSWSLLSRQVSDLASVITRLSVGEAPVNASDVVRKTELDTHAADGSAHGASSEATAGAIIKRDNAGRAKVADPSDNADIATKKYVDDNAGASSFLSLSDTPSSYTGAGSKVVRVKSDESALEFVEAGAPGAHHTTHESGGSDAIKLDDLAAPDDNTDLDVSTSKHGLCPKAPNDTTKFLRGDGAWGVPAGGGSDYLFRDQFADASIHESWITHNLDANRLITEVQDVGLKFEIKSGSTYDWWSNVNAAPKLLTGLPRPGLFEMVIKISSFSGENKVAAGAFIGRYLAYGSNYYLGFGLSRDDSKPAKGVFFEIAGTQSFNEKLAAFEIPIWLKLKVFKLSPYGGKVVLYKSTDGASWIQLYTEKFSTEMVTTIYNPAMGLFAKTFTNTTLTAVFNDFSIKAITGAG